MSTELTRGMVAGMLEATVRREVRAQVLQAAKPIALEAVAHALTPELLDELREAAADAAAEAVAAQGDAVEVDAVEEETPPSLRFKSLPQFVEEYVLPNWRHTLSRDSKWCVSWWKHAEAITHLEALWESFEELRLDPAGTAVSVFLLQYMLPHMTYLTSPQGPFWLCSAEPGNEKHKQPPVWAVDEPPQGMFAVAEQ